MDQALEASLVTAAPVALNSLITLITGLVHKQAPIIQSTHADGTGPVKFTDLFTSVITNLQNAAALGQIPKVLPPDSVIQLIMQAVVTSMKLQGQLTSAPTTIAVSSNQQFLKLSPGQSITITG